MFGLPVVFVPLQFPIFEANSKYLTETSCILLNFGSGGVQDYHFIKSKEILEVGGGLVRLATFWPRFC